MGLTNWKNSPAGPVRKADVRVAKNYLLKEELEALNLIVSAYLDCAELQARGHRPMHSLRRPTKTCPCGARTVIVFVEQALVQPPPPPPLPWSRVRKPSGVTLSGKSCCMFYRL